MITLHGPGADDDTTTSSGNDILELDETMAFRQTALQLGSVAGKLSL